MAPGQAPRPRRRSRRAAFEVEALEARFLLATWGAERADPPSARTDWVADPEVAAASPVVVADAPKNSVGPRAGPPGPGLTSERWELAVEDSHAVATIRPGSSVGLVVPEVHQDHDKPEMAQALPMNPEIGVIGTMSPTDWVDMYLLRVGPGDHIFRFDIHLKTPPGAAQERVSFFDRSGMPLSSFPIPAGGGEVSVIARESGSRGDSALYIAINRAVAGTIVTSDPYWLQVTRLDPTGPTDATDLDELASAGASPLAGRPLVLASPPAPAPDGPGLLLSVPIGMRQAVVGTWPLISSGSAGGVLDANRPIQPTPRGSEPALDLDLIDLPAPAGPPVGPESVAAGPGDRGSKPIALRSAGGFPLLGSGRRAAGGLPRLDLAHRPAEPPSPLPLENPPPADVPDPRPASRRLPLRAGLGVAAVLALGLFLPDLAVVLGPAARWRSRPRAAGPRRTPSRAR